MRSLVVALVLALGALPAVAQPKTSAPTSAQGPAALAPLSFADFHSLAFAADYLKRVAAARPAIAELLEIGRSPGGRAIQVLVVSNLKKGVAMDALVPLQHPRVPPTNHLTPMKPYMGKPAQWIDGGFHGDERVGAEACLYIIDKLVSGYGTDPELTALVDGNTFYICPVPNPDGFASLSDGKSGKADGAMSANGNFPEGWWKDDSTPGGYGEFPSSTAEARAILEFFTNHTNILLAQSFDAGSTVTYRPFARWPESRVDGRDIAVLDRLIGKKYLELMGEAVPASWTSPLPDRASGDPSQGAPQGRRGAAATPRGAGAPIAEQTAARVAARSVEQARLWRSPYNNERQTPAGYGVFYDWAFGQFGAFAMSTGLVDTGKENLAKACETAWQFERYKATLLPHVAITDASAKVLYTSNQATRAAASQDGSAVTIKKSGAPGRYKVVQVTATIENSGVLPTQTAGGTLLRGNREDVIWLLGANGKITFLEGTRWLRLGVLQGTLALPPSPGAAAAAAAGRGGGGGRGGRGAGATSALSQMRQQRPDLAADRQTGSRRIVSWLVAIEGDAPLKLAVTSQKGGTAVRDLAIQ